MIYTEISALRNYRGISTHLDTAIDYLLSHSLEELAQGRNEVDGENVYINRFDYQTVDEAAAFYEAHLHYADIHLLLSGSESIKVAEIDTLQEFERDESTDYVGYHGAAQAVFAMNPAKVLIVFPREAHMVKLHAAGKANQVQKAVCKVNMD